MVCFRGFSLEQPVLSLENSIDMTIALADCKDYSLSNSESTFMLSQQDPLSILLVPNSGEEPASYEFEVTAKMA